jgi:translation initiation factor 2 alpha subunit (eIF-2alpha)
MTAVNEPHFFYAARLPVKGEFVIVEITKIQDMAIYCTMSAYGDFEGMIPITEVGIKKHKRVTDYVRIGQIVVAQVLSVIEGDGERASNIDLTMGVVHKEEREAAIARYHRDLRVNNFVRSTAGEDRALHDRIYSEYVWPQGEEINVWLEKIRVGELTADADGILPEFVATVMLRYPMPSYTEATDITVRFGVFHDGVARLNAFLQELAARPGIQVVVTAPPKYRVTATAATKEKAAAMLAETVALVPPVC